MHNKPSRQYTAVAKHSTLATRVELIFYNKDMIVKNTSLEGLLTIEPKCFNDERGFFLENYQEKRYKEFGITDNLWSKL